MVMVKVIDANLILRYLLGDPEAAKVEKLLRGKNRFLLSDVVLAEIVWVLDSYYEWDRSKIVESLAMLIRLSSIVCNRFLLTETFTILKDRPKFDFADAYSVALAKSLKIKEIYSFDRDFDKIPGIKRAEPK